MLLKLKTAGVIAYLNISPEEFPFYYLFLYKFHRACRTTSLRIDLACTKVVIYYKLTSTLGSEGTTNNFSLGKDVQNENSAVSY